MISTSSIYTKNHLFDDSKPSSEHPAGQGTAANQSPFLDLSIEIRQKALLSIIREVHHSQALFENNTSKRLLRILQDETAAILEGFGNVRNSRLFQDETIAFDTTTTPFECLLRTIRIIESYLTVADYYQDIMGARPSKYGYPGYSLSQTNQLRYWTITDKHVAQSIGAYFLMALIGRQEKALKYFTATTLARALEQGELPEKPDWVEPVDFLRMIFPSPSWNQWWNGIMSKSKLRKQTIIQRFSYNFYMAKNASLSVPNSFVQAAIEKHKAALCGVTKDGEVAPQVNAFNLDLPGDLPDLKEEILESIERAANEIFWSGKLFDHYTEEYIEHAERDMKNEGLKKGDPIVCQNSVIEPIFKEAQPPRKFPSLGASYAFGRFRGGAAGELFYNLAGVREDVRKIGDERHYYHQIPGEPVFLGFASHPTKKYLVEPVYGTSDPLDAEYEEDVSRDRALDGQIRFGHQWSKERDAAERLAWHYSLYNVIKEDPETLSNYGKLLCRYDPGEEELVWRHQRIFAEVVPLLEAFKVRTITKGDMDPYHLGRRWQSVIHGRMRKHPASQLIGAPCNKTVVAERIVDNLTVPKTVDSFYVSGDYESATDLLNPALSLHAQNCISQHLRIPLEDQIILNRCLTGHFLVYKKGKGGSAEEGYEQQWGQLMGSPASFPVLCLINLAATRLSFERMLGKKMTLRELPMLVNGDDILFRAINNAHYELWKRITKVCGLKFSIGKNYTSKKVLVINSEMYKVTRGGVRRVPILNMRLLYGGNRSAVSGFILQPKDFLRSLGTARVMGEKFYGDYIGVGQNLDDIKKDRVGKLVLERLSQFGVSVTDRNFLTAYRLEKAVLDYKEAKGSRLEDYKKWFITVPARQYIFREQLKGDYHDNVDEMVTKANSIFCSKQIGRLMFFGKEFPRAQNIPSICNYLPRALGGLGLIPPTQHRYNNIDASVVQGAHEKPDEAYALVQANHIGLTHSHLMACATAEIAEVCKVLDIKPEFIQESELHRDLELFGQRESPFSGSYMRGFANLSPNVSNDELNSVVKTSQLNHETLVAAKKFLRTARARCARWKRESESKESDVPKVLDLNLNPQRLLGGFWNVRVQRYPAMV